MPIPTGWAWLLLESILGRAPLKKVAKVAAKGASLSDKKEDEDTALSRIFKFLQRLAKSGNARPATEEQVWAHMRTGTRHFLGQLYPAGEADRKYEQVVNAKGPFTVLATLVDMRETTQAHEHLMVFSEEMDSLGAAFAEAAEQNDFARARDILLNAEALHDGYWSVPEECPDATANREKLRGANDWDQLIRAVAPILLNVPLSWLSLLDIAIAPEGVARNSPLFQDLITQPLAPSTSGASTEADRRRVPVANLVRMIEGLSADINAKLRGRPKPPKPGIKNSGDQAKLRDKLNVFKKHDLLTAEQFGALLTCLRPDAQPNGDERCGFDPWALLLACNLFSMLTPRDGARPDGKTRLDAPEHITCFPGIEGGYMRWWQMNRAMLAGDTAKRPRPF
ncbi:MAG: hypothetical protein KGQ79_05925 [Proteobacteria bacterium]|nr:hypothetical protein [Pseudomonadota bacterium]